MTSHLDNPIWNALNSVDKAKNIGSKDFAFFDEAISPFIGMQFWDEKSQRELLTNVPQNRTWFLLLADKINFIDEIEVVSSVPLFQFVCPKLGVSPSFKKNNQLISLNSTHIDEMIALTKLTKPGPFAKRTIEFGNYHGIFAEDKLVAMGGERLHVNGFSEVSAICTYPEFRGLGYGAMITHFLSESIIKKGQTPFLHVRVENASAINVYQKLGFEIRSEIQFYMIRKRG